MSNITSQDSVLEVFVKTVTDPAALAVLVATVFGFILPMLWIYPPVAPRPSDFLNETHSKLGQGWSRIEDTQEAKLKAKAARAAFGGKVVDDASSESAASTPTTPTAAASSSKTPAINSLWIYPIKSCGGIQVQRARVLPLGFEFDRLFTFAQLRSPFPADAGEEIGGIKLGKQEGVAADKRKEKEEQGEADDGLENWDFITQRQFPLLAALQVELWQPDLVKVRRAQAGMRADYRAERNDSMSESYVVLRYPWSEPGWEGRWAWFAAKLARGWRAVPEVEVVLPLSLPADNKARAKATYAKVRIWRDTIRALDMSAELPRSLQLYLGVSNRLGLMRIDPDHLREIYRNAPRKEEAGYQPVTGFQDAYPVHLLNRSSVRHLETVTALDETLPDLDERRFRANIIVEGFEEYDEDTWKMVSFKPQPNSRSLLDEAKFYVCARTVRCIMPNIHPDTGEKHKREPDYSLRKFRDVDEGCPRWGCLGMQMAPYFENTDKPDMMELTLEAGMSVTVLQKGAHKYIKI